MQTIEDAVRALQAETDKLITAQRALAVQAQVASKAAQELSGLIAAQSMPSAVPATTSPTA
jgi:hypothetical protein